MATDDSGHDETRAHTYAVEENATADSSNNNASLQFPSVVVHSDQIPIVEAESETAAAGSLPSTSAAAVAGGGALPAMTFSFQRRLSRKPGKQRRSSRFESARLRLLSLGPSWCSNADIQKHLKLILLSSFFCTFGVVLLIVGVNVLSRPPHPNYSAVFIVGGVIIFIPGIYHLVYVLRAYLGHEGYSFQDLPLMD